jgi:histidyl-tRNA synthetase
MTDTSDVFPRARATLPRGFADRDAGDLAAAEAMIAKIGEVYALYGFEAVETPFIEYTDALGKFLPDQDRPNEGVFSFKDDDEQWLSLRYDLTAPLARYVAENYDRLPKPYRSYRAGWVFRNEKPGPGRFRQFMQFDADTVGSASPAADAEICMMAADCLEALGIKRGDYVIKVNNRKVLDGVMESIGLGGPENGGRRLTVLRAIDKLDRLGIDGVRLLLGSGRKDESGDFTKGAGLSEENSDKVILYLSTSLHSGSLEASAEARRRGEKPPHWQVPGEETFVDDQGSFAMWRRTVGDSTVGQDGVQELEDIAKLCRAADYGPGRIIFSSSVVRGLEYYTGPVFEAELTFEVKDDDGRPVRFGSVGGGGRYDGLVARFRAEPVPATGFSIGVSRLLAALRAIKSPIVAAAETPGPVVVLALDRDAESMANYQRLVASLRDAAKEDALRGGPIWAAELYLGSGGMNAQLKYADRRRSRVAVIQGSNERNAEGGRQVTIRDLRLGAELAKSTKDRADYLELRQRAQFAVEEGKLVARVREVLARG